MSVFDRFQNQTRIQAILEMHTALSVGSRGSLEPTGTDLPVMKGPDGVPFIPGSSIKGAFRALAERILRTFTDQFDIERCENGDPVIWACDPLDKPCVPERSRDDRVGKEELWREAVERERRGEGSADAIFAQELWNHSCTACRLFGSPWFAGRVAFKDAFLLNGDELPVVTQIRDGVGIDRDLGAARSGVKYDFEVVVPGARFGLEILMENVDDWELGFLLTMLRLWEDGNLALGGKVTRGPGWGKLVDTQLRRLDQNTLLDYLLQGQQEPAEPTVFITAFQEHIANALKQNGRENDA
ncbi:MAG: CRISPR-associated RAMP protein [Deltaproteobacteria bacterium]|nr:CRISPR-associated RAMP protein [Deltaproteobacteria bacterium]